MGSSGSSTTTAVPWGPQGAQLADFYSRAGDRSNQPIKYFPGSTIAGRDAATLSARDRASQLGGSDYRQAGQKYLGQVLGGDFMKKGNPYLDNAFGSLSNQVTEQFNRVVMPGVNSQFAAAGRSGSSAHGLSAGRAQGQLADSLSDIGSRIYYGDYENRSRERMTALGLEPSIQGLEYQDIGQQRASGALEENYLQRQLDDSINRFNFAQTEPDMRLNQFGKRVGAGAGGFGTTTSSGSSGGGGAQTALGIIGSLLQVGGSAIGGPAGGIAGGLLGNLISGSGGGFGGGAQVGGGGFGGSYGGLTPGGVASSWGFGNLGTGL